MNLEKVHENDDVPYDKLNRWKSFRCPKMLTKFTVNIKQKTRQTYLTLLLNLLFHFNQSHKTLEVDYYIQWFKKKVSVMGSGLPIIKRN